MNKEIDWANLGFAYMETEFRYEARFKNGKWNEGALIKGGDFTINESACVLQYAQTGFEGLKAYRQANGNIVLFRPDMNAKRFSDTCRRIMIPEISEKQFIDGVKKAVLANEDMVPPYGVGASLYIRPFAIGFSPIIAVKPADEFLFRVFVTPVGPYFKGGIKPVRLVVSDYDRAAPVGTGHIKAGLNYAMSFYAGAQAQAQGFDMCLFLDSKSRKYIEETMVTNIVFVTKDKTLVIPKSKTILPSITRQSLHSIAKNLGIKCIERKVRIDEISSFSECGLCGTAAIIAPVASITHKGTETKFIGMGPLLTKLYETYQGIQLGTVAAPKGWIQTVK